ncbi:MAG: hypothetical protein UIB61_08985, partial [Treponema sp.]|nr:hypothetical protein [Treponema sp.]
RFGYGEVFFRKNYLRFSFRKCSTILLCHTAKATSRTPNLPFSFRLAILLHQQKTQIFYYYITNVL